MNLEYPAFEKNSVVTLGPVRRDVECFVTRLLTLEPRIVCLSSRDTVFAAPASDVVIIDVNAQDSLLLQDDVFLGDVAAAEDIHFIFIVNESDLDRTGALFDVVNSTIVAWPCSEEEMETTLEIAGAQTRVREHAVAYGEADLHSLKAEVERVAQALDRLVQRESDSVSSGTGERTQAESATLLREIIRKRRLRADFFPAEFFADPAWDILLDLAAARHEGKPVSISSLCIAASVPTTTGLRWIKALTDAGLLERTPDPTDGRRSFVTLSERSAALMERYLDVAG